MGQIQASSDFVTLKTDEERWRFIKIFCDTVTQQFNGNIEFISNIKSQIVEASFVFGQNTQVTHNLGRIPVGYVQIGASTGLTLYNGEGSWTATTMFLIATGTGSAKILVF